MKPELFLDAQNYKGIPLLLIDGDYSSQNAFRFQIGQTDQRIWIPKRHCDKTGHIKVDENIDYILRRSKRQLEHAGITWAIPGIKRQS